MPSADAVEEPRRSARPDFRPLQMVGRLLTSEIMPAAVTAPAPIYKMYSLRILPGDISAIFLPTDGAIGPVRPSPKNLISGMRIRYESTPPPSMMAEIYGPII